MRAKAVLAPAGRKVKLVWNRLTLSKLITAYFVVALIHCFVQVVFQLNAFSLNTQAEHFIEDVMRQGNVSFTDGSFVILDKDGALRQCWDPSKAFDPTKWCKVIWSPKSAVQNSVNDTLKGPLYEESGEGYERSISATAMSTSILPTSTSASSASAVVPSAVVQVVSTPPPVTTTVFVTASTEPVALPTIVQPIGNNPIGPLSPTLRNINQKRSLHKRQVELSPTFNSSGQLVSMKIMGLRSNLFDNSRTHVMTVDANDVQQVSGACVQVLEFPLGILKSTKREDIVFIAFQFWVLGMSIVAVLNESVPHAIAALSTHVLATAWSVFQIFHTRRFRTRFTNLVTNGACKGVNLLPSYWVSRSKAEIPILALNTVALVVIAVLTWRVLKAFGWQTFKRIGADIQINRIYKMVLIHSITLQLSIFFIVVSMALWIDQLYNSPIGRAATHGKVYRVLYIIMYIGLIPWIFFGWTAVRRENRIGMTFFIVFTFLFIVCDASMFASTSWRLTFLNWTFFALMSGTACFLTAVVFLFGILCRLNFGRDLSRYLQAEEETDDFNSMSPVYPEKYGFPEGDEEKVALPSPTYKPSSRFSITFSDGGVPTSLSSDPEILAYTNSLHRADSASSGYSHDSGHVDLARNPTMRTEASWRAGDDTGRDVNINAPRPPMPPIAIPGRVASPAPSLARSISNSSGGSFKSSGSDGTIKSFGNKKRWVIE